MIDYSAVLYDPVFDAIGVPATMNGIALTVIDDTRRKMQTSGSVEVRSVGPGAFARIPELSAKGITRDAYKDSALTFNGRTWTVRSYELTGSPNGEDLGEVRFLLMAIESAPAPDLPDWVPADAKIHIDLVGGSPQGRAWVDGVGEVAIDTLLGSDPNTVNGWGESGYNPAYLTAEGYLPLVEPQSCAFIGAALAAVLPASTFVIQWRMLDLHATAYTAVLSASGNAAVEYDIKAFFNSMEASSWTGPYTATISDVVDNTAGSINKMAVTLTPTRSDVAVNGSTAITSALTIDDYPISGEDQLVAFVVQGHENIYAIQSLTIYDPLPDTTGLSELSDG